MALMIVVSFMFQVFTLYSICNQTRDSVQRAVLSVAAANKPMLFDSLKEGNTFIADPSMLIVESEICDAVSNELGLAVYSNYMVKESTNGGYYYRISDITVSCQNTNSDIHTQTVTYVISFVVEVPVASYWNYGTVEVPMQVQSRYTAKY